MTFNRSLSDIFEQIRTTQESRVNLEAELHSLQDKNIRFLQNQLDELKKNFEMDKDKKEKMINECMAKISGLMKQEEKGTYSQREMDTLTNKIANEILAADKRIASLKKSKSKFSFDKEKAREELERYDNFSEKINSKKSDLDHKFESISKTLADYRNLSDITKQIDKMKDSRENLENTLHDLENNNTRCLQEKINELKANKRLENSVKNSTISGYRKKIDILKENEKNGTHSQKDNEIQIQKTRDEIATIDRDIKNSIQLEEATSFATMKDVFDRTKQKFDRSIENLMLSHKNIGGSGSGIDFLRVGLEMNALEIRNQSKKMKKQGTGNFEELLNDHAEKLKENLDSFTESWEQLSKKTRDELKSFEREAGKIKVFHNARSRGVGSTDEFLEGLSDTPPEVPAVDYQNINTTNSAAIYKALKVHPSASPDPSHPDLTSGRSLYEEKSVVSPTSASDKSDKRSISSISEEKSDDAHLPPPSSPRKGP